MLEYKIFSPSIEQGRHIYMSHALNCGDVNIEELKSINPFCTSINVNNKKVSIITDIVRSHPLFYTFSNQTLLFSDKVEWLLSKSNAGSVKLRSDTLSEFHKAGFVSGKDTLIQGIYQVPAGTEVIIDLEDHNVNHKPIYDYTHSYNSNFLEEDFIEQLHHILKSIFQRLISVVDGRQIVIPLSGGLDSRLILLMLKELGYDNLAAFTYGSRESIDTIISKSVADQLNVEWHFVEYSTEKWNRLYNSNEKERFFNFTFNYCSLPHIQDWLAIRNFWLTNKIDNDAFIVAGHSADMPAGSFSNKYPEVYKSERYHSSLVTNAVFDSLYSLHKFQSNSEKKALKKRIRTILEEEYSDSADAFESYFIKSRISNFIVNSMRTYEMYGFNWWLPFWDPQFFDFWRTVPVKFRINQKLYIKFINILEEVYSLQVPRTTKEIYPWYRSKSLKGCAKNVLNTLMLLDQYESHPLKWYGIMDKSYFRANYSGSEHINSFLTDIILNEIKFEQ